MVLFSVSLDQWFPTLDYNFQTSWPAQLVVKDSENFSPKTSGDPGLEATALKPPCYVSVEFPLTLKAMAPLTIFTAIGL